MSRINLIVGLGNPGPNYQSSRHNAGFWFLNALSKGRLLNFKSEPSFRGEVAVTKINNCLIRILRPQTFMNESGHSVAPLARYFKIEPNSIMVVHDDLDLEPGIVRLKEGGGHGGHNGLRDLIKHLGTNNFCRLRLGIGRPDLPEDVTDYVLKSPSSSHKRAILGAVSRAEAIIEPIITGDHTFVMN